MISVTIDNLSISAGNRCLFHNVSFQLEAGESIAILGQSGVGKTSLAQAIVGQLAPGVTVSGGQILVDSTDPLALVPRQLRALRRRCAYVDQDPGAALPPRHTVRKIVSARADLVDKHITKLLSDFGLRDIDGLLERKPHELSGGQRRRVSIAAGVAANPELLIIDEPTAGVDAPTVELMVDALRTARMRTKATTIVITHDTDVARALADKTVVLTPNGIYPDSYAAAPINVVTTDAPVENAAPQATPAATNAPRTTATQPPRLAISELSIAHHNHEVVSNFHLDVYPREIVALTGPSGVGKTSILGAILGLLPARHGSILIDGNPIPLAVPHRSRNLRSRFGWIPQESELALNPHVPVRSLLTRTHATACDISHMLRFLELPDFFEKQNRKLRPDDLSGGQRQRVNVAIGLLSQPDLLLADEPTSALDVRSAELVLDALRRFRTPDSITVVVSHDAAVLDKADRVVDVAHVPVALSNRTSWENRLN